MLVLVSKPFPNYVINHKGALTFVICIEKWRAWQMDRWM